MTAALAVPAACQVNVVPEEAPGAFTGITCGEPAACVVEYGCVHEHVKREQVCARHAGTFSGDLALACTSCWAAGHLCQVTGRVLESGRP